MVNVVLKCHYCMGGVIWRGRRKAMVSPELAKCIPLLQSSVVLADVDQSRTVNRPLGE